MPIDKPLVPRANLLPRHLPGTVGVYELADDAGEVIYIGYAGGRSLFGLRGVLEGHFSFAEPNPTIRERAKAYRYEITTNYLIRRLELLSRFSKDYSRLPAGNEASDEALPPLTRYGRSSPTPS